MSRAPSPALAKHPARQRVPSRAILALGLLLLAAHILFFTRHTDRAARAFDACAVPPNTIPGLAEPRFFLDNDAYAWMAHTRDLMASGGWRLRHTSMDNAPYGREMHWSHLLIWSLRGMAMAIMTYTGWPAARALELAGVWMMPIFQFLCLGLAFVALARKLGWVPAGLFCYLFLSLDGLSYAFHPLQPDHHGLQLCATLFAFIFLQLGGMGWTQRVLSQQTNTLPAFRSLAPPLLPEARRWFIASGLCGGVALWLGATVWLFALALIVFSSLSSMPAFSRPGGTGVAYRPGLWRLWAFAGCAAAAIFYLLEYAPAHLSMRLEVNHPLYWIGWLGTAECLRFAGQGDSLHFWKDKRFADWVLAALGGLAALALPLLILFGPMAWHRMHDPILQRLHAGFINEFRSAWPSIRAQPVQFFFDNMGILPVWALGLLILRLRSWHLPQAADASLRSALVFSGLFFFLMLFQLRWGFFLTGSLVWLAILSLSRWIGQPRFSRRLVHLAAALLFLNALAADGLRLRTENAAAIAQRVPPSWIRASLSKRMALQWGLAAGTNQWRMVGMATEAPMLYYFTGIQSVASYYWENVDGWRDETDFFADAPSGENALRIARKRGLTHAFAKPTEALPLLYNTLKTEVRDPAAGRQSLAGQLAFSKGASLPAWIQRDGPLTALTDKMYFFQTPDGPVSEKNIGQIFRLQPDVPVERDAK